MSDPRITAMTDQVMAETTEYLARHIKDFGLLIDEVGETEAFERQVIASLEHASAEQIAVMYARALLLLVQRGVTL